ncbi:MAG: MFS transporter [Ruminococcaceae bacterium]|nr:MFS transporter [Oscillospiraceae bacterium]
MASFLIAIIYIAFISLGLPDSLLGSAWPVMYGQLDVPLSYMGIISMIISAGTIVSSFASDFITRKLGTGLVTAISVLMTAAALFGFSVAGSFALLCVIAVPYGLGAGAVDAALNNYVALHYSSKHMSWLHCFWGVGAAISPYIMGFCLTSGAGWQKGYFSVSIIQIALTAALFLSLPLWKKRSSATDGNIHSETSKPLGIKGAFKIKGVPFVLAAFFCYCSMEATTGLWASSYLKEYRGTSEETAAMFASLFYLGITFGRFICGFVADKLGDKKLIRIGIMGAIFGIVLIILPVHTDIPALGGLVITGIGCAPVYPSIIHSTPSNFGKENSQSVIGIQMAFAYIGTTLMPPFFGVIADNVGVFMYPFYLLFFAAALGVMSELLNKTVIFDRSK